MNANKILATWSPGLPGLGTGGGIINIPANTFAANTGLGLNVRLSNPTGVAPATPPSISWTNLGHGGASTPFWWDGHPATVASNTELVYQNSWTVLDPTVDINIVFSNDGTWFSATDNGQNLFTWTLVAVPNWA